MGQFIDLTGQRFGRVVVIERIGTKTVGRSVPSKRPLWKCLCDCGNELEANTQDLRSGHVKSCGCLHEEVLLKRRLDMVTHGDSCKTSKYFRLYEIWKSMKKRCENPNANQYKDYGGRGISVCDEWHNYIVFKEWALNNGYSDELSIDRINNDDNYRPDNCRWVDRITQARNRRSNIFITINGETKTVVEWCQIYNIDAVSTVYPRIRTGMDPVVAILTPPKSVRRVKGIFPDGTEMEFESTNKAAEFLNVNPAQIRNVLSGHTKTCRGIKWEYISDQEDVA